MTFEEVLDQAIDMVRRRGRVTYHTLQRQFQLDDDALRDLKDALLYAYPEVHDEVGRGLVWTGTSRAVEPDTCSQAEAERQFHTLLLAVRGLLQREQRVTYRTLRYVFGVDETCLHAVRDELHFRQLAREEDGQGLVWTGADTPPAVTCPGSGAVRGSPTSVTASPCGAPHTARTAPRLGRRVVPPRGRRRRLPSRRRPCPVSGGNSTGSRRRTAAIDRAVLRPGGLDDALWAA
jgi:hypothetical protein